MNTEANEMYEEVTFWHVETDRLRTLAREMSSSEQDDSYISRLIEYLFEDIGQFEPDDDGINTRYTLDFEHPDNRDRKLVFEFRAFIKDGK